MQEGLLVKAHVGVVIRHDVIPTRCALGIILVSSRGCHPGRKVRELTMVCDGHQIDRLAVDLDTNAAGVGNPLHVQSSMYKFGNVIKTLCVSKPLLLRTVL